MHARSRRICVALVFGATALGVAGEAAAQERTQQTAPARKAIPFAAFEAQGMITGEMLPKVFLGVDGALAFGNDTFNLRLGAGATGARPLRIGAAEVSNLLTYGLADVCAGKTTYRHRVRMCLGGEAGVWSHFWRGFQEPPGKRRSPHIAGTLKGDYQYMFTDHLGMLLGAGVSIPVIGPEFQGRDELGRSQPQIIPGPVAGTARIGVTYRFR